MEKNKNWVFELLICKNDGTNSDLEYLEKHCKRFGKLKGSKIVPYDEVGISDYTLYIDDEDDDDKYECWVINISNKPPPQEMVDISNTYLVNVIHFVTEPPYTSGKVYLFNKIYDIQNGKPRIFIDNKFDKSNPTELGELEEIQLPINYKNAFGTGQWTIDGDTNKVEVQKWFETYNNGKFAPFAEFFKEIDGSTLFNLIHNTPDDLKSLLVEKGFAKLDILDLFGILNPKTYQ